MARRSLSVEVDERLLEALRRASESDGVAPDEVVEQALRRYFGLRGLAILADIEESQGARGATPPDDDEWIDQAVAEVRAYRAASGGYFTAIA